MTGGRSTSDRIVAAEVSEGRDIVIGRGWMEPEPLADWLRPTVRCVAVSLNLDHYASLATQKARCRPQPAAGFFVHYTIVMAMPV